MASAGSVPQDPLGSCRGHAGTPTQRLRIDTSTIIAGFIISTVGFSFFLYGKKQKRVPQFVLGILLMIAPFAVTDPLWMSLAAVGLLCGLRAALALDA